MKKLAVFACLGAVMFAAAIASAADSNERPAGVEENNWILITERLGFVVVIKKETMAEVGASRQILIADPEKVSPELMPPKKGYFVVKTKAGWQRVVIAEPAELAG